MILKWNTMEQDQLKKLSIELRIVQFLASKDYSRKELKSLFEKFYFNFKIQKQKKEISNEEFEQFLVKCLIE